MGISSEVVKRVGPIWPPYKISIWCIIVCQVDRLCRIGDSGESVSGWWMSG